MVSRPNSEVEFVDISTPSDRPSDGQPGNDDADLLFTGPLREPSRVRLAVGVAVGVALVAGAVLGFVVGRHQRPTAASLAPTTASSVPVSAVSIPLEISDWMRPTGGLCGVQLGTRSVQLGVQFVNGGPSPLRVDRAVSQLPLGGLRMTSAGFGSACGQFTAVTAISGTRVPVGQPMWLLATFDILAAGCPAALPVGLEITFQSNGHEQVSQVGQFPDLAGVRVAGC